MSSPKHVGIVGGGVAGLYTALLLRREGHRVTVYEATSRVGGRIYTHHFQSLAPHENTYFEAGAMRIPRSPLHQRVYNLIRYLNTHGDPRDKVELIPYILEHENNRTFFRNQKHQITSAKLGVDLNLPPDFHHKTARQLLGEVVRPWLELLRADFDAGFSELLKYDELSFRAYLRFVVCWPHEVVEFVELLASQTNQYDLSFTEIVMQNLDFDTARWATVRGGMSRLTQSAANLLDRGGAPQHTVHLNAPVTCITELPDGRIALQTAGPVAHAQTFDKVVLAIPPAALHNIAQRPTWSFMKEQAIRGAHYEPLYKMGVHFRTRFWEQCGASPCFGGQSTTDLRFRWIVYPSNDMGSTGPGVLLLYAWMNDAARWQALSQVQRVELALHDLQRFFRDDGVDVYREFIEAFDVAWSCQSATGDAMFLPGQFSRFHAVAKRPEGNVFFAGEHLSRHHTWIAGAVDSALEAVKAVLGDEEVSALGEEFGEEVVAKKRMVGGRKELMRERCAAYAIPSHNNIQYVEDVTAC